MGDVIGDLNRRRGQVSGMEQRGNAQVVTATVPLAEMFGYATDVRSTRRAGPPTRCSSSATTKSRRTSPRRSSARRRAAAARAQASFFSL